MNLLRTLTAPEESERMDLSGYVDLVAQYGGFNYLLSGQSQPGPPGVPSESPPSNFEGMVKSVYQRNGVVAACFAARMGLISEARFKWRVLSDRSLFGNEALGPLERPTVNESTGDILARFEQDASLAGNGYRVRIGRQLHRVRPDWMYIILGSNMADPDGLAYDSADAPDSTVVGYAYWPKGKAGKYEPKVFLPSEVAHYAPEPDPLARFRGTSWLTQVLREIDTDRQLTEHKAGFLERGATPSFAIKYPPELTKGEGGKEKADQLIDLFREKHEGVGNSWKALHLFGGADPISIGSNFRDLDYKAVQGAGEPLALTTPIPTPGGWVLMGDLRAGDKVLGRDGRPANVVAALPVHRDRPCYRVSFDDGTSVVTDGGHRWVAVDRSVRGRPERVFTTAEIRGRLEAGWNQQGHRMAVPAADPLDLKPADLPLHPYLLGAWLGDGETAGAAISGAETDLRHIVSEVEDCGYSCVWRKPYPNRCRVVGLPGGVRASLIDMGLLGNKHIPAEYLRASYMQRLDLLRGLMDTDGSADHGRCEISSKYEHLARQYLELVRSLGLRGSIACKAEPRSRTGETWRVYFHANQVIPFTLPRKVARVGGGRANGQTLRSVLSVEEVESVPVRCIAVDTADHLFLAGEGMIPTHNTRIASRARVPAAVLGISEGLQGSALNAGNFGQARRQFGEQYAYPSWRLMCEALRDLMSVPSGAELWYDTTDVAFLHEDAKDAAEVNSTQAQAIRQLIEAGYEPDAAVTAVTGGDLSLLSGKHTGLVSVQLQPPGAQPTPSAPAPSSNGVS